MTKELRVYIVNLDNVSEQPQFSDTMPIEDFVKIAEDNGSVFSIGGFARNINNELENFDDLTNSYIRFAWVDGKEIIEETGMVVK